MLHSLIIDIVTLHVGLKRVKAGFTLTRLAWDTVTDTKTEFPLNSPFLLLTGLFLHP